MYKNKTKEQTINYKLKSKLKKLRLILRNLNLRNRILVFTSLIILGTIISILIIVNLFVSRQININLEQDLINTKMVLEEFQESQSQRLLTECRMLAQQPAIKEIISIDNPIAIAYETEKYQQLINSELFAIISKSGSALKIIDEPYKYGDNLFNAATINQVLKGKEMIISFSHLDKIFQVAFVPIKMDNETIGTICLGYEIDKKIALELKKISTSDISFMANNQIVASTLPSNLQEQLREQLLPYIKQYLKKNNADPLIYNHQIILGNERYITLIFPINPDQSLETGFCLIQKSVDQAMAFINRVRNGLLIIAIAALAISFAFVYFISQTITNPLKKLMIGVNILKEGDYDHEVKVVGGGEVELLANAFDDMRISLKEQIQQVKTSEDFLRRVIESSSDAIFTLDLEGKLTFINPKMEMITKYKAKELIGKPLCELVSPDNTKQIMKSIEKAAKLGLATLQQEILLLPKEGFASTALISLAPLVKDFQVYRIVGTTTDISERIELQKRLIQTERLASMGQAAASLAHEINNPLGIILGFTQDLLSEIPKEDNTYKNLKIIEQETSRCAEVVKNLLDFTRSRPMEIRPVKLDTLLDRSLSLVSIKMKKNNITIKKNIPPNLPLINADSMQLRQVFINILLNSIQSMPKGGNIIVSASYDGKKRTSNEIILEIADTGSGISPSELERIFDPFYSGRKSPGTGLGLAICHQIIEAHQGHIEMKSKIGEGTQCIIRIPVMKTAISSKKIKR